MHTCLLPMKLVKVKKHRSRSRCATRLRSRSRCATRSRSKSRCAVRSRSRRPVKTVCQFISSQTPVYHRKRRRSVSRKRFVSCPRPSRPHFSHRPRQYVRKVYIRTSRSGSRRRSVSRKRKSQRRHRVIYDYPPYSSETASANPYKIREGNDYAMYISLPSEFNWERQVKID